MNDNTWPSTATGLLLMEDEEDDYTEYDTQHTEQQLVLPLRMKEVPK